MVQAPKNAGSTFHKYKGTHSVVLLAVCDAHYRLIHSYPSCTVLSLVHVHRFLLIDIGDAGRHSDGGILANSEFGNALEVGSLSIPEPCPLPGTTQPSLPYIIVGDEAFPLRMNMLRPYPGKQLSGNVLLCRYYLFVNFFCISPCRR